MKIWVVGATGMLGSAIFLLLRSRDIDVFGTDSKEVDITSLANIENFVEDKGFSHIINCSAYTKVDEAERNEKPAFAVNAYGVKNLALVSKQIKAKVLHFSTDYVFSGEKRSPYLEEDVPSPSTVYGKSKLLGEEFLLSEAKDSCIIRTSWLFGFRGKNFVKTMVDQLQKKEEVQVVFDQTGRPTFCDDLAEAALSLLPYSGIFHFANDKILSWYDFTKLILDKLESVGLEGKFPSKSEFHSNILHSFRLKSFGKKSSIPHLFLSKPLEEKRVGKIRCKKIIPVLTKDYPSLASRPLYSVLSTQKIENTLKIKAPSLLDALENYILKSEESKVLVTS